MTPLKETENEGSQRLGEYTGTSCKPREGRLGASRNRGPLPCPVLLGEHRTVPERGHGLVHCCHCLCGLNPVGGVGQESRR